jgi:hypothetical protein
MKVVYVPNINNDNHLLTYLVQYLTPGKIYDVIGELWEEGKVKDIGLQRDICEISTYNIIDDFGNYRWFDSDILIPLEKYREDKLNQLGI